MTLVDEADLIGLTEAYIDQLDRLAGATGTEVRDVFLELEHLNRADVDRFAAEATPYFRAARSEAIDLTSGYLSEATGARLDAIDLTTLDPDVTAPFLRTWHNLKEGQPWAEARQGGASQAEAAGYDYAQAGAAQRMANPGTKVRGYRRVLSPTACEWCRVVSTQLYKSAESARFGHHKCKCTVVAVATSADPGRAINRRRLASGLPSRMGAQRDALKASGAMSRVSAKR